MADWKIVTIVHRTIFRWSGGRVGAKLGGIDMAVIDSVQYPLPVTLIRVVWPLLHQIMGAIVTPPGC
jgi:hypothetical protein